MNVDHVETDLVVEKSGNEVLDLGNQCWALGRHLPESTDNRHVVLVEFDRAVTQVLDILIQTVSTGLNFWQAGDDDRPRTAARQEMAIHLLTVRSSIASLSPPRGVQLARAVQVVILPLANSCRQPPLLSQLLAQEPRESPRALVRPVIHGALHRRIGHHRLGLSVGASPRGNEIECRLVGVARSAGDDRSKGAQVLSPRIASECRSPA